MGKDVVLVCAYGQKLAHTAEEVVEMGLRAYADELQCQCQV